MNFETKFRVETPYGVTIFEIFRFQNVFSIMVKDWVKKNFHFNIFRLHSSDPPIAFQETKFLVEKLSDIPLQENVYASIGEGGHSIRYEASSQQLWRTLIAHNAKEEVGEIRYHHEHQERRYQKTGNEVHRLLESCVIVSYLCSN